MSKPQAISSEAIADASTGSFLPDPPLTAAAQAMYDEDVADDGYVWNLTRVWAYQPETQAKLDELMAVALASSGLSARQRGVLVTATASTLGDSYCSFAWGRRLARYADPAVAAGVLSGTDAGLTDQEQAMAAWARKVTRDPNSTTSDDVQLLRDAGLDEGQIVAITAYIGLRIAMATVDDALGARPDAGLVAAVPAEVRAVVDYGRRPLGE
jgi:uncharacterized peroxidase-related enzyme